MEANSLQASKLHKTFQPSIALHQNDKSYMPKRPIDNTDVQAFSTWKLFWEKYLRSAFRSVHNRDD